MSTKGNSGSRRATPGLARTNAQWFLRLSLLFAVLAFLTAILLVLRESGFYMFAVDGIATTLFTIVLSVAGEFVDRRLMHSSILLYKQMVKTGLIEISFREAIELDSAS